MDFRNYKNKRVLVTGGSGFVGNKLSASLASRGAHVHNLDRDRTRFQETTDVDFYQIDLANKQDVFQVISSIEPEIVFHLAANISRSAEFDTLYNMVDTNLVATMNLFSSLRQVNSLQSVIVAGTAEEYGINRVPFRENLRENPISPYSFSKVCQSHLCHLAHNLYGIPAAVLRASLAYGPGQAEVMFIPSLIKSLLRGEQFLMTAGEQFRDFLYIDDLIEAYLLAGSSDSIAGEIFNIGLGKSYKIKDVAMKIGRMLGREHLLVIGEVEYRKFEVMEYQIDFSKAREILHWTPKVDIEQGLRLTIEGFQKGET
jgi:UDP-glucose 4-epimerase